MATALNLISGQVGYIPDWYLDHPILGEHQVEVEEGRNSYDRWAPKTKDEYFESLKRREEKKAEREAEKAEKAATETEKAE